MIDAEVAVIKKRLEEIRSTASRSGETITSDGATDTNRRPMIIVMSSRNGLAEFISLKDCSGEKKTAAYCAKIVIDHINSLPDPRSVVQARSCFAARAAPVGRARRFSRRARRAY